MNSNRPIAPNIDVESSENNTTPYELIKKRRGWDAEFFQQLNQPATRQLDHLDQAISLIHEHISTGKHISVLTDFDMDGIASGLLTYAGLAELGANVNLVIPDYTGSRQVEPSDVDHALTLYPETQLIITCDQGTNSVDGIKHAQNLGLRVIITDHHHQEVDCPADVLVNPNAWDSTYDQPDICGAQVAFHMIHHYAMTYANHKLTAINLLSMFAGIGALADVMPLTGQTRTLMKQAIPLMTMCMPDFPLNRWGSGWEPTLAHNAPLNDTPMMMMIEATNCDYRFARIFYGFSLLLRTYVSAGKIRSIENIDANFIGFTLAPTFNATRRVEGDMHDSFHIFAPQSVKVSYPGYNKTQDQAAQQLIENNELRKKQTKEALELMDNESFDRFISFVEAPAGIMGLLASHRANATGEPAIVLNPHNLSGSGRAPMWFNIIDAINTLSDPALMAQGHQQACGVRVNDPNKLQELYDALAAAMAAVPIAETEQARPDIVFADIPRPGHVPDYLYENINNMIDLALPSEEQLISLINELNYIAPFGHGFDYPTMHILTQVEDCTVQTLGSDKQHLKITLPSGMQCLWWNSAQQQDELDTTGVLDLEIQLSINNFMGKSKPQGIVREATINGRKIA